MKISISVIIILSSFIAWANKLEPINWYSNNLEKLSNQLDIGKFYSNIIDENLVSAKLRLSLVEAVFRGYLGINLEIDDNDCVKYVHFDDVKYRFIFEIKKSRIYPIYVLRQTNVSQNSTLLLGSFLYTGSQFIYFKEKEARGGRKPADRYLLLERLLLLNKEFKTLNMIDFNFENIQMDGQERQDNSFKYRLFSINADNTFCLHFQNSAKTYNAEKIKVFFDLLNPDYSQDKCEIKYQFEFPYKDSNTRIWYESSPNKILKSS